MSQTLHLQTGWIFLQNKTKQNKTLVEWDRKNTKGEWEAEENSEAGSYYVQEFEFEEWQELETFFAQIVSTCCHVAIK